VSFSVGNESDVEVKFLSSIATIKNLDFSTTIQRWPSELFRGLPKVLPQKLGHTLHYTPTERAMPYVEPPARTSQILHHLYAVHGLTLRRLMSYIYGAPILDVSRSHTTTQHSR